ASDPSGDTPSDPTAWRFETPRRRDAPGHPPSADRCGLQARARPSHHFRTGAATTVQYSIARPTPTGLASTRRYAVRAPTARRTAERHRCATRAPRVRRSLLADTCCDCGARRVRRFLRPV